MSAQFKSIPSETYLEQFHPGDHTLVDIREPYEWATGHLPGAIHIPMNDVPDRLSEIPTDKPVVIVCEHGSRSLRVAQFLIDEDYTDVYDMQDGTHGWRVKGLPIER